MRYVDSLEREGGVASKSMYVLLSSSARQTWAMAWAASGRDISFCRRRISPRLSGLLSMRVTS